ncbi:hypothetical protein M408DRAFT_197123 [Serendipita vermifera MAFF 305830]|uniref:PNPLA domain-containing protein n=1 Tax=Serendipita vermifera MAFF 305830 TaxID=933852 RepID=A0A0C3ANM5_SERVB|nr:hypothetical protein M408DRAFT_197123 [Serendipita vermifera MAFF 305830]
MSSQANVAGREPGLCLLSLDAGGPRGVSQLAILGELMHRIEEEAQDDQVYRPCGVFDMIGGVGSGGIIAILLVVLGLTVEEARSDFIDLSSNVLESRHANPQTRTAALQRYIDRLLRKHKIDPETRILNFHDRSMKCKLAIPISYRSHAGSIGILRNYTMGKERALDITIAEALMVTLATPPMFTYTQILKDSATFEYIGAEWTLSNPTEEILTEAHATFGAERQVACIMSLGCGHPGVIVAPKDSNIVDLNTFLTHLVTNSEGKAQQIDTRMGHLGLYHRFSVRTGLERTSVAIGAEEIVAHTQAYLDSVEVSEKLDGGAESLRLRDGISSLDQLKVAGGRLVVAPQAPPVTETFVMRKEPWEFVKRTLLRNGDMEPVNRPRKLIVTGIGGCGKSQLLLKFMKDHKSEFSCQVFIDGSSKDRIRANTMQYVRSLGTEHSQKSFEDCLVFLSSPSADGVRLLLYDNVDDPDLDLAPLLPWGDSCAITVTSRNALLGELYPEGHLRLDIMAQEEAVELLLLAYNPTEAPADQNRTEVTAIAEALGYLPIALQQACAYMRQTKITARKYLQRLSTSKKNLLSQSIKHQLDSRSISTYAAFETSFSSLPVGSQKVLRLLSYFHWGGFPLELVEIGAEYEFWEYEQSEFEIGDELSAGSTILEDVFYLDGKWDASNLDTMTSSLQSYSLISVIPTIDTPLLQMHPLAHEWVRVTIPEVERGGYQSAAVLLLALGAREDRTAATLYLASHVTHMSALWKDLELYDAVAFRSILEENGAYYGAVELQEMIVGRLRERPDLNDDQLPGSFWVLADIYHSLGRLEEAEKLQKEVVEFNRENLGEKHPNTINASSNLALTYRDLGRLNEAMALQEEVLRLSKEVCGGRDPDTISASNNLASTYRDLGRLSEAKTLFEEVLELRKEILGQQSPDTIDASNNLAATYRDLGSLKEAGALFEEVLKFRRQIFGERHPVTISASSNLANAYRELGRLNDAEALQIKVLKLSKEILGERHHDTISASNSLGVTYRNLGRLKEAEALQREVLKLSEKLPGERHSNIINASCNLALTLSDLGKMNEAEALLSEMLKLSKDNLGERHPHTINTSHHLAIVYRETGRLTEAKGILEKVLKDARELHGERHLNTLLASSDLAAVLRLQGKLIEAEDLTDNSLKIRLEIVEAEHFRTLFDSYRLAAIYHDQKRFNEAEARLSTAIVSMRNTLGTKHYVTTEATLLLAKVCHSLHRTDEARELLATVEPIISEILGKAHPQYLELVKISSSFHHPNPVSDTAPSHTPEASRISQTSPASGSIVESQTPLANAPIVEDQTPVVNILVVEEQTLLVNAPVVEEQTPLASAPIVEDQSPLSNAPAVERNGSQRSFLTTESIMLVITVTSVLGIALYISRRR